MWCGRPGRLDPGRSVAKAHRKLLLDRFCQQAAHEFHGAWDGETGSRRCLHPPTGACSAADRARSTVQKQPSSSGPAGLRVIRSEHCDPRAIQKLEHPCPAAAPVEIERAFLEGVLAELHGRTVMQGRVRSKAGPGLQPVKSSVPSSAAGDRRHNASARLADLTAQGEAPPISFLLRWCAGAQHRQKQQHRPQQQAQQQRAGEGLVCAISASAMVFIPHQSHSHRDWRAATPSHHGTSPPSHAGCTIPNA